jgi:hypothetical protein
MDTQNGQGVCLWVSVFGYQEGIVKSWRRVVGKMLTILASVSRTSGGNVTEKIRT